MKQNNNYDSEFDQLISEALKEEFDNVDPPISSNEAWNLFKGNRKRKKYSPKGKKTFYLVSGFIIFIMLFFMTPQSGSAFNVISKVFNKIQGNVVQLFIKQSESDDNNSISDEIFIVENSEAVSKSMNLEQAEKVMKFPILFPIGVNLEDIIVTYRENEKSEEVFLIYSGDDIKFTIRQMKIDQAFGLGAFADQDDIRITDTTINGYVGNLIKHKNGMIELVWITNSYYLSIDGVISEDEIIKIAESL